MHLQSRSEEGIDRETAANQMVGELTKQSPRTLRPKRNRPDLRCRAKSPYFRSAQDNPTV